MTAAALLDQRYFSWRGWIPVPIYLAALLFADFTRPLAAWEYALGAVALGLGLLLRGSSRLYMGRSSDTRRLHANHLVVDGPYAWVRNPIYLGNACFAAGLALLAGAAIAVPALMGLLFLHYYRVIVAEERMLAETFGTVYLGYLAAVPRFLPRWSALREGLGRLRRERKIFGWVLSAASLLIATRVCWSFIG